jgi:hypothetical protein
MKRKKDLRRIPKRDQKYWEERLRRAHLSMARGTSTHLIYVGGDDILARIAGERQADTGRVMPLPPV